MSETYAFGIDVGGTTIKHGLFNGKGELLESWEIPTRTEENGKNILPDIAASIRGKMKEKSITAADVKVFRDRSSRAASSIPASTSAGALSTYRRSSPRHWRAFRWKSEMTRMSQPSASAGRARDAATRT